MLVATELELTSEFQSIHGQHDNAYVTGLYQTGLGRAPSSSELQYWSGQLQLPTVGYNGVFYGIATSAEASARLSPAI